MKNLIFILLVISAPLYAQQKEASKDSLPPVKKEIPKFNEKLEHYLKIDTQFQTKKDNNILNTNLPAFDPLRTEKKKEINITLPPLNLYTGPPLESITVTNYPFINDYTFSSARKLSDDVWLTTSSIQRTYPTLGAQRTIRANFNYQPLDWLVISGGPYASKYNLGESYLNNFTMGTHFNAYNDVGVGGAFKFILHDRIRLNVYGQYSVYGKENKIHGPMMNMFPQTFYGGTIELKITEKFGIEGGLIRELNPINGKWQNRTIIAPVFY